MMFNVIMMMINGLSLRKGLKLNRTLTFSMHLRVECVPVLMLNAF